MHQPQQQWVTPVTDTTTSYYTLNELQQVSWSPNLADKLSELCLYPIFKQNPQPSYSFPWFTEVSKGLLLGFKLMLSILACTWQEDTLSVSSLAQNHCYARSPVNRQSFSSCCPLHHQRANTHVPSHNALDATVIPLQPEAPVPGTCVSSQFPHTLRVTVVSSLEMRQEGKQRTSIHEGWALESSTYQSQSFSRILLKSYSCSIQKAHTTLEDCHLWLFSTLMVATEPSEY